MTAANFSGTRINAFIILLFLLTSLVVYRLFNLTLVRHSEFVKLAKSQYNNPSALLAGRGNIYFSDLANGGKKIAAANRSSFYLYSNNKEISSASEVAVKIALILSNLEVEPLGNLEVQPLVKNRVAQFESLLSQKDKTYQAIARGLTKKQADQISALKIKGLTVASEISRFYAQGASAAHVLGFVGFDGNQRVGQYGIEFSYDDILGGEAKTLEVLGNKTYSDILNFFKFRDKDDGKKMVNQNPETINASDIVLTIDQNIQSMAELTLGNVLKKWGAPRGSVIIEDPYTGAILAMASSPSFDPNNYSAYDLRDFINPNVQEVFEPGSSFKPITMSAAVDSGVVTPNTTYNDTGEVKVGDYTIRNFNEKANGIQTMRQVLEHSLNTGAIFAQEKTGDDSFLNYVVGFGFSQKTGVDLGGEATGNISNLFSGRKINFLTASFGQGIAVTPLQLANAFSAIANGGKLMRPYLVKEIIRPEGTSIKTESEVLGAPITEKTSAQLKSMLVDVVDRGFDKARIKGYDVAGKTGTAQIPNPDGGGYLGDDQFIHDFVGFAPAYAPRFVILIKMERPKGIKFAADSLSPVFGDMARYLIRYFNIPPTR